MSKDLKSKDITFIQWSWNCIKFTNVVMECFWNRIWKVPSSHVATDITLLISETSYLPYLLVEYNNPGRHTALCCPVKWTQNTWEHLSVLWVSKEHRYLMTKLYQNPGQSGDVPSELEQNTASSSCNVEDQMMMSWLPKLWHDTATTLECEPFTAQLKL